MTVLLVGWAMRRKWLGGATVLWAGAGLLTWVTHDQLVLAIVSGTYAAAGTIVLATWFLNVLTRVKMTVKLRMGKAELRSRRGGRPREKVNVSIAELAILIIGAVVTVGMAVDVCRRAYIEGSGAPSSDSLAISAAIDGFVSAVAYVGVRLLVSGRLHMKPARKSDTASGQFLREVCDLLAPTPINANGMGRATLGPVMFAPVLIGWAVAAAPLVAANSDPAPLRATTSSPTTSTTVPRLGRICQPRSQNPVPQGRVAEALLAQFPGPVGEAIEEAWRNFVVKGKFWCVETTNDNVWATTPNGNEHLKQIFFTASEPSDKIVGRIVWGHDSPPVAIQSFESLVASAIKQSTVIRVTSIQLNLGKDAQAREIVRTGSPSCALVIRAHGMKNAKFVDYGAASAVWSVFRQHHQVGLPKPGGKWLFSMDNGREETVTVTHNSDGDVRVDWPGHSEGAHLAERATECPKLNEFNTLSGAVP